MWLYSHFDQKRENLEAVRAQPLRLTPLRRMCLLASLSSSNWVWMSLFPPFSAPLLLQA